METDEQTQSRLSMELGRQRGTLQAATEHLAHDLLAQGYTIADDDLMRVILLEARCRILEHVLTVVQPPAPEPVAAEEK